MAWPGDMNDLSKPSAVDLNVVRHEYRVLTDDEKAHMKAIKDMGQTFIYYCDAMGRSREISLAITKMEEAVMWAVKHLTR
jgi:hypothetical protein